MPNRIIHERANTSETLASLDDGAERHFWRLIVQADDYGYLDARPEVIRARAYPMMLGKVDEQESERRTLALTKVNLLHLFVTDSKRYGHFPTWDKYQQKRAKYSKFQQVISCDSECNQAITDSFENRDSEGRGGAPLPSFENRDIRIETLESRIEKRDTRARTPAQSPSDGSELLERFTGKEITELQTRFEGADLNHQADRCVLWWRESKKPLLRPKSAFNNWMERWQKNESPNGRTHGELQGHPSENRSLTGLEQTREYLAKPLPPIGELRPVPGPRVAPGGES